jgi:hypothetical protein
VYVAGSVVCCARVLLADHPTGNEGSNPILSACKSSLQRISAVPYCEKRETCQFFAIFAHLYGLEGTDCSAVKGVTVLAFLLRALVHSGFKQSIRRMLCDHKPGIPPKRVDLSAAWKPHSSLPGSAVPSADPPKRLESGIRVLDASDFKYWLLECSAHAARVSNARRIFERIT